MNTKSSRQPITLTAIGVCMVVAVMAVLTLSLVTAAAVEAKTPKRSMAQNRATAMKIMPLLPDAPEDWVAGRPTGDWRGEGAIARRAYRPKTGSDRIVITVETGTSGMTYKKDLLQAPAKARDRGYLVKKIKKQLALIRHSPFRGELRLWVDHRILVLIKGKGPLPVFEALAESIDYAALKAIK